MSDKDRLSAAKKNRRRLLRDEPGGTNPSGSGDKGTPVIIIQGYFDNYISE